MVTNESDFTTLNSMTNKGLYSFSLMGKNRIRVKVESVSGGYLTVTGKFVG